MEVNAGAYVINLLRRPERKARMQALCAPLVAQGLPVEVCVRMSVRSGLPCDCGGVGYDDQQTSPLTIGFLLLQFLAATDALELDGPALTAQGIRLFHPWQ
jgi:hypothetical protein